MDLPSGLDADTGVSYAAAADLTVTFGVPKPVHVLYPGKAQCGRISIADIGLDDRRPSESERYVSFAGSCPRLPQRSRTAHKGNVGRVAVIAGSAGLTGAACLASEAALRAGSGLVTLGIPESLNDIAEVKLTEVMSVALPEIKKQRCLSLRARGAIQDLVDGVDAIAIGPGIGRNTETRQLVKRLIGDLTAPTILDADGLNAFEGEINLLRDSPQPLILTPHPGEYRRLTGQLPDDQFKSAAELAAQTGAVVVLKGAPTVVALPGGSTYVNLSGNPGMATGDTGDVLTGIIASLVSQACRRKKRL